VNRLASMFSQILKLFPRIEFERLVRETQAERHARGFSSWGQFVAMLSCQLGRAHSMREICHRLSTCEGKLLHLGIVAPKRSSLAYANEHRPCTSRCSSWCLNVAGPPVRWERNTLTATVNCTTRAGLICPPPRDRDASF